MNTAGMYIPLVWIKMFCFNVKENILVGCVVEMIWTNISYVQSFEREALEGV